MRVVIVSAMLLALAGCGGTPEAYGDAASSEAVQVLKAPDSPYSIIYSPPVDLNKKS